MALAERCIAAAPQSRVGYLLLARAAYLLSLLDTAAYAYEQLCGLFPAQTDFQLEHADILLRMEKTDLAIQLIEGVLVEQPEHQRATRLLKQAAIAGV